MIFSAREGPERSSGGLVERARDQIDGLRSMHLHTEILRARSLH